MFHPSVFGNVFCKYITVALDIDRYGLFMDDLDTSAYGDLRARDQLFVQHLKARKQIQNKEYKEAIETLKSVIDSEAIPPRLLLYLACADMELCCKATDDYKGAYEFSQNKIEILEHMLAEK
jgi:hypothetical protein